MRDEVVGDAGEDALENVGGVEVAVLLKKRFRQQAVGFEVFGVDAEDVFEMGDGFVNTVAINHPINFLEVDA